MSAFNVYQDGRRARAYDRLEFGGTYHLAFRDLPEIIGAHVRGRTALDFGCGTGRSTRFLKRLGLEAVGVDIASDMLRHARGRDPRGDYRRIGEGDLSALADRSFDLVLSAFTFDNVPGRETRVRLFRELGRVLTPEGVLINLVSSPEIYFHEWASFSTRDFPENREAKAGDVVRIITTDLEDRRPCLDVFFPDDDYRRVYGETGLDVVEVRRPLADGTEPYAWVSETRISPWTIYVLRHEAAEPPGMKGRAP
jgi:SAM-dependent methyltransferase